MFKAALSCIYYRHPFIDSNYIFSFAAYHTRAQWGLTHCTCPINFHTASLHFRLLRFKIENVVTKINPEQHLSSMHNIAEPQGVSIFCLIKPTNTRCVSHLTNVATKAAEFLPQSATQLVRFCSLGRFYHLFIWLSTLYESCLRLLGCIVNLAQNVWFMRVLELIAAGDVDVRSSWTATTADRRQCA